MLFDFFYETSYMIFYMMPEKKQRMMQKIEAFQTRKM
jgi:hypothetical protein